MLSVILRITGDQYGEMGMIVDEEFGGVRQSSEVRVRAIIFLFQY